MPEFDSILKVKEDAEANLRKIAGVHAVGIGKKLVKGSPTDDLSIMVFVTRKKPLDQLSAAEIIPAQIGGVKTDVVELPEPQLMMAGDPSALIATISANQLSVNFTGKNPEEGGLLVVMDFTVTQGASTPDNEVAATQPASWKTLNGIAADLAREINGKAITGITATATGAQMTLAATAGTTCAITHCEISAIDDTQYFADHLRGGIQIQTGTPGSGHGTIGFLATTAVTAEDPQGKVVALTCQHVVCPPRGQTTNLVGTVAGSQITFSTNSASPIPLQSLVEIKLNLLGASFFYNTVGGDAPPGIATGIVAAVTQAAVAGVSAIGGGPGIVSLTVPAGTTIICKTYGPPQIDHDSDLKAAVTSNKVTFTGAVSGDDYGIFTSADAGGLKASAGVFTQPNKGDTLSSVASAVADAFGKLPATLKGNITATATANTVTFDKAETVTSVVKSDMQVGQPDNSFGSPCSRCCSHRIGRVIASKIDVDVAVIQIDAGQKWVPEIEGLGLVIGTHAITPAELPLNVLKRGRTLTKSTLGSVISLKVSGDIGKPSAFNRHYVNAMLISSLAPNNGPFSLPGDSGAGIVDFSGAATGILFGGGGTWGWATSIDQITSDAFPELQLDPAPAPEAGHAPGDIRTVPKSAMAALTPEDEAAIAAPRPFLHKRIQQVEQEISVTPEGSEYAEMVKRHFAETQRLVNSNRRVATIWHRNRGPLILQAFLNMLQRDDALLPKEINGQPLADCLERIKQGIARYASPALAADLARFAPRLQSLAGLSYTQMLSELRSESGN
jgi:hypothetical protein